MKIIADSMAFLPRYYINELLSALFPTYIASLQSNHEFFTLASMLLKQTQTQAAFASLCLEHVLTSLRLLDTEREEPSIWLELARLCTNVKLTDDMMNVYCCYLPVAEPWAREA